MGFASAAAATTNQLYFGYQSFAGVLPAVALFVLFGYFKWPSWTQKRAKAIAKISGASFGVYLMHRVFIQDVLFVNLGVDQTAIWLRVIAPFVIWALCVAITLLLKKIPVLRRLVP